MSQTEYDTLAKERDKLKDRVAELEEQLDLQTPTEALRDAKAKIDKAIAMLNTIMERPTLAYESHGEAFDAINVYELTEVIDVLLGEANDHTH